MQFSYKTRGNTSPLAKRGIFVHAMPMDQTQRDQLIQDVLALPDGRSYSVWFTNEPEHLFEQNNISEIQHMNLFVIIVSEAMLAHAEKHAHISFESISVAGLPVLPVFCTPDVIPRFNKRFGNLHGLSLTAQDYRSQLEVQLKNRLVTDQLVNSIIADAFTGQVFLSYRKKDRAEALRIMHAMHNTPWSESLAIWYDEFLTGGRDFNEEIRSALENSEAVCLVVTPSLLEPDNYVYSIEYPYAVKASKDILPIEAKSTDHVALETLYKGIPRCISLDDADMVEAAVFKYCQQTKRETRDFYLKYLLGMAYLIGLRVEKDVNRAKKLLIDAANRGIFEAARQLGMMYLRGIGVKRDIPTSIQWKKTAFQLAEKQFESEKSFSAYTRMHDVLESNEQDDGLAILLMAYNPPGENKEYSERFLRLSVACNDAIEERLSTVWRAGAYFQIANLHFEEDPSKERIQQALDACESGEALLAALPENDLDVRSELAGTQDLLAEIKIVQGDISGARENSKCSYELWRGVCEEDPSMINRWFYARACGSYGQLLIRYAVSNHMIEELQKSRELFAVERAICEQLYQEEPNVKHRESLAGALYHDAVNMPNGKHATKNLIRGRKIMVDLIDDINDDISSLTPEKFDTALKQLRRRRTGKIIWMVMLLTFVGLLALLIRTCA